jgi:hypothetical protein
VYFFMDTNSAAYQGGVIAGALMAVVVMLGILVFFVLALVKAISTRRTGWIIGAVVSGVPFLFLLVAMGFGFVKGFKQGMAHSSEMAAAQRGEPSELLTAPMTQVSGVAIPYEISLPSEDEWTKNDNRPPYDHLYSYRDAYVGVIAEAYGAQTSENACDLSQRNVLSRDPQAIVSPTQSLTIDSHTWLTYDVSATVNQIQVKYRFYVYGDPNYTFQIMTWTSPSLFNHDAPVFDRIAKTFQLPK